MLHVGIDAWNLLGDRRGIGRYLRAILREWLETFSDRVRITLIIPEWHTWTISRRYLSEIENPLGHRVAVVSRRFHKRANLDVVWFPFNGPSWLHFQRPAVATLHDASTFALPGFDDTDRATFRDAAKYCDTIITDSEFSRNELIHRLDLQPERIVSIPLGVSHTGGQPDTTTAQRPYILFVGESEKRKGIDILLDAFDTVSKKVSDLQLVIVGRRTQWLEDHLAERPMQQVTLLGHTDDTTLASLFRNCAAFVYPSQYEGFGLPILEAMAYGAPVIASNVTAIPETGGDAAMYFPPADAPALARVILDVLTDSTLREELRAKGYSRAATMTWKRTAERTLTVLERTASLTL